jgi:hypothetical protein
VAGAGVGRASRDGEARPDDRCDIVKVRSAGGAEIRGLVIEDPTTGWVIVRVDDSDPRHGALLGTGGGLLQVDLQAGRVVGMLIPTGRANGLIGAAGRSIWLYAPDGVVARVDR